MGDGFKAGGDLLNSNVFYFSDLDVKESERWVFCSATHKGTVRKINEDGFQCWPERGLALIADGMGGHESGDVASAILCESLHKAPLFTNLSDRLNWIEDQVNASHKKIRAYAKQNHGAKTVGSTLVIWVEASPLGSALWAGDSRLYRIRDGALEVLTRDHSQLNEMLDRGLISEAQAQGKKGGNVITRAVGAREHLHMETKLFEIRSTDLFILCSDGLNNAVPEKKIYEICSQEGSLQARSVKLMQLALESGARDNVTFMLIGSRHMYSKDDDFTDLGQS